MKDVNRRAVLCGIAIAVLARASPNPADRGFSTQKVPHPVLTRPPGNDNQLALTIDDGASVQVVGAFADFCRDSGIRLTFFVNGANSSWSVNAPALRPMVDSGQIQMGNHTWSHPDITRIGSAAVADQIRRNADFLRNTYGVDGIRYFRPPYGRHTPTTDPIAADQGYTTTTLWSGSIGDDVPINDASLIGGGGKIVAGQTNWARPHQPSHHHPLLPPAARHHPQPQPATVTLNDVFA